MIFLEPEFIFNRAMAIARGPGCLDHIIGWVNKFHESEIIDDAERDRMIQECEECRPRFIKWLNDNCDGKWMELGDSRVARDLWWEAHYNNHMSIPNTGLYAG